MAIVNMKLPKCDVCGEEWLPDKYLRDESGERKRNPARTNPELSKRCGKCKTPKWNKGTSAGARQRELRTAPQGASASERERDKPQVGPNGVGLEKLYGVFAGVYKDLGGGEEYLRNERDWGPDAWEKYEQQQEAGTEGRK